jgi:hypothetical protein
MISDLYSKIEQHIFIKFCVMLDKSSMEILEMVREDFGEHCLDRTTISEKLRLLKAG